MHLQVFFVGEKSSEYGCHAEQTNATFEQSLSAGGAIGSYFHAVFVFMTVLAYVRMRRLMYRKRWSKLQESDRRSGRFSQNFVPTDVVNEEIRSSKLVIRFKKHQTELRFSDFLWKEFKVKHDILAFFFNSHLYFGRKELFAIFILRILIKLNVLAIMFDMQRATAHVPSYLADART